MARARSQEKNKGQLLTCVPSQSGPGSLARQGETQCKILNGEGSAGSECHVPGKPRTGEKKVVWRDFRRELNWKLGNKIVGQG